MTYILTAQRHHADEATASGAFQRYRAYIASIRADLPPGAFALASSDWYFDSRDPQCPHDAWLETATISESGVGDRGAQRGVSLVVQLLGAYHDGQIVLRYLGVTRYRIALGLDGHAEADGHRDWRYDEIRLGTRGRGLVHEIEWWGPMATATWLIEAAEIEYQWRPFTPATSGEMDA